VKRKLIEFSIDPPAGNRSKKRYSAPADPARKLMPHSLRLTQKLAKIFREMVDELGGVTWRYRTDDWETVSWDKWKNGTAVMKQIVSKLQAEGHRIDMDRVCGILVSHLSPFDKRFIREHADKVNGLLSCIQGSLLRWRSLINSFENIQAVESFPFPKNVIQPVRAHARGVIAQLEKHLRYANAAQDEIEKYLPLLRKTSHNPGRRKAIGDLMPLFVRAGLTEVDASHVVLDLLKCWDLEANAGTAESIRATYQVLKR
jgi:hypothetical protein